MGRLADILHEMRIWWAKECAMSLQRELMPDMARLEWRRHADLIAQRSPGQVARMERRMGIN